VNKKVKVALICGGPSFERGISLNSARSVLDHLEGPNIEIVPIYFDHKKNPYSISTTQLYSNTPSDFDFKLQSTAKLLSKTALKTLLKSVDIAFPVMHGQFGEDGGIQRLLERYNVPYIGSDVDACKRCFDKYEANEFIKSKGFYTLPSAVLKIYHDDHKQIINDFFKKHDIKRAIIKPATGGSSIGVFSVGSPQEALEKAELLFSKRMDTRVVIEPFCEGTEFTVIILQNRFGMPVAVLPTEVETDYQDHQIFDYRKKYLPTRQVTYHCPPRFSNEIIEKIQVQAEQLFTTLGMRDFARFDGWLMPDGNLWFSDFNPISGMEQNSFLFQQGARVGLSHREILSSILRNAGQRYNLNIETNTDESSIGKPINVIFGGDTSERQVSLMSGTNSWLKLRESKKYSPKPFLLDTNGDVWKIPYAFTLNHTVEEIMENCKNAKKDEERLHFLIEKVQLRLAMQDGEATETFFLPEKITLDQFIEQSDFAFIGLHGGMGEDGTIQGLLRDAGVPFNGPSKETSEICMDKYATTQSLRGLDTEGIFTPAQQITAIKEFSQFTSKDFEKFWKTLQKSLNSKSPIVKPQTDGCSSGVVRLYNAQDLQRYIEIAASNAHFIAPNTLKNQPGIIEMPVSAMEQVLFETFIETDSVKVVGNKLRWKRKQGWIEVTTGVLEENGKIHALNPSLTVASGQVLSVEEKFQGGTGVNITPPSEDIVKPAALKKAKRSIEKIATVLGIQGYSRIDTFMHVDTGDLIIIEVNTTPALTPSTVLFHQGLAEEKPMTPRELLERLIENKGY
jgi:D-alanine--D-alanine ligase